MNQVTRAAANALAICHFSFLPLFMYCHYRISESLRLPQAACSLHLVAGGLQRSRIPLSCKERSSRNAFGSTPGSPRPTYSPSHNSRTAARPGSPPHARARVAPRSVHYDAVPAEATKEEATVQIWPGLAPLCGSTCLSGVGLGLGYGWAPPVNSTQSLEAHRPPVVLRAPWPLQP